MQTVGKNRVETLDQLRNGGGEFYIPDPSAAMTCEQLDINYNRLNDQLSFWSDEGAKLKFKFLSGDKKEAANIASIIEIQTGVLSRYEKALEKCVVNTGGGGGNGGGGGTGNGGGTGPIILDPPALPAVEPGIMDWIKKNPVLVAAGGIGLVLLLKKRNVAGTNNKSGLLLAAVLAVIIYNHTNKAGQY